MGFIFQFVTISLLNILLNQNIFLLYIIEPSEQQHINYEI